MIVKNEEKNIEKALSWAKDVAIEQIVVDTGSTDKTVEIAEKMGAKVYHFKWIDDFAAAKNFAMNKATGDWIAILDADEYMQKSDATKLMALLTELQNNQSKQSKNYEAIICSFIDLDDNGNAINVSVNQRFFKNSPHLRFVGRIHEAIAVKNSFEAENITIYHTGYSQSSYADTDKKERNIKMLRAEHKRDPQNPDIMHYLASSIRSIDTDDAKTEAEELHLKAFNCSGAYNIPVRQLAYDFLIPKYTEEKRYDEAIRMCDKAIADLPKNIDYLYYRALLKNKKNDFIAALKDIEKCENAYLSSDALMKTQLLVPTPLPLYYQKTIATEGLSDTQALETCHEIIKIILSDNIYEPNIVGPYIRAMAWYGEPDDKILSRLSVFYDIGNPNELMFIVKAAKESGAIEFTRNILEIVGQMIEA